MAISRTQSERKVHTHRPSREILKGATRNFPGNKEPVFQSSSILAKKVDDDDDDDDGVKRVIEFPLSPALVFLALLSCVRRLLTRVGEGGFS